MEEMTAEQRLRLGWMVRQARIERYPTKLAAYQDVGINSATWDRIEKGESVKDHTLRQVIKRLWPSAGGDWRQLHGVKYGDIDFSVFGDTSSEDYPLQVERWISELQARIELLEKHVYTQPKESPDAQRSAPSKQAGGSPAVEVPARESDTQAPQNVHPLIRERRMPDPETMAARRGVLETEDPDFTM